MHYYEPYICIDVMYWRICIDVTHDLYIEQLCMISRRSRQEGEVGHAPYTHIHISHLLEVGHTVCTYIHICMYVTFLRLGTPYVHIYTHMHVSHLLEVGHTICIYIHIYMYLTFLRLATLYVYTYTFTCIAPSWGWRRRSWSSFPSRILTCAAACRGSRPPP